MGLSPKKQEFVDLATVKYGEGAVLDMDKIKDYMHVYDFADGVLTAIEQKLYESQPVTLKKPL